MIIKFITLPESNCSPGKQSWANVANLLKNKIESNFKNEVEFRHIEFMSENWFNDNEINELAEKVELKFPVILTGNKIFSNGEKVNISRLIKSISQNIE